jgi:hypothetical protein
MYKISLCSDYWSWGPGFDSRFCQGDFSLKGKIPMVIMVWVVFNLGLRPLLVLHIHISPSASSGQRNYASWASQHKKSVTLRPQPGGETTKSIRDMWWHWPQIATYKQRSKSNWPPAAVMPVDVKNSRTGAGSQSGKKAGVCVCVCASALTRR